MVAEILVPVRLERELKTEVFLNTGEVVHLNYRINTKRFLDGRYVSSEDDLFRLPLKPGDHYITEVSNVAIRFTFTKEHLTDWRGRFYFYYKHLEKLRLVSISPIKLEVENDCK